MFKKKNVNFFFVLYVAYVHFAFKVGGKIVHFFIFIVTIRWRHKKNKTLLNTLHLLISHFISLQSFYSLCSFDYNDVFLLLHIIFHWVHTSKSLTGTVRIIKTPSSPSCAPFISGYPLLNLQSVPISSGQLRIISWIATWTKLLETKVPQYAVTL